MSSPAKTTPRPRASLACRAGSIVLMALGAAAGVIALGEVVARYAFDPPVNPYTPHPYCSRVRTPGYKQVKMTVDDPARPFLFETDPLGYRGKNVTTARKPAGSYRIFFVGASTTENQQLEEERTFPGIVERVLNERLGGKPRVEVANTGIVGYGIERTFALVSHQVLQLEPDLIVVNDGGIDMIASLSDEWDPANLRQDAYTWGLKDVLCERSRLLAILDARFSQKDVDMRRRSFEKRRRASQQKPTFVPKDLDLYRGLPLFATYLRRLALVCEDAHVPLVLMTQAMIWKPEMSQDELERLWMGGMLPGPIHLDPATLRELQQRYNDAIKSAANERRLGLVDLDRAIPKDLDHFYDDAHLTARGNERAASTILNVLGPYVR